MTMFNSISNVSQYGIENSMMVILTRNNYLLYGLKALINSMTPKLLNETSRFYDVMHVKTTEDLSAIQLKKGQGNILITDFDPRLCAISKGKSFESIFEAFDGIMVIKNTRHPEENSTVCLSLQASISQIRRRILNTVKNAILVKEPVSQSEQLFTLDEALLLNFIIKGFQPETIASILKLDVKQVYARRSRLYRKAGVKSLQELYNQISCM